MDSDSEIRARKLALTADSLDMHHQLAEIVRANRLSAVFQPVLALSDAAVIGYEGLIRGPSGSQLHTPLALFDVARDSDRIAELEYLCRKVILGAFAEKNGHDKIFINVSPDILGSEGAVSGETLKYIRQFRLNPKQVVIEITENTSGIDYNQMREAVHYYRKMGFEIAIDDLGEGFSGLRLWSELRPNYVKIDKHFIRGIHRDPLKFQFVRSIQEIAKKVGTHVIAEGIEHEAELVAVRRLGITFGQGYFIARPHVEPFYAITEQVGRTLQRGQPRQIKITANLDGLILSVPPITPRTTNLAVYEMLVARPEYFSIPVVKDGVPIGVIGRQDMIALFARPFHRELFGQRSCETFMDRAPLVVESSISPMDLSELILNSEPHHLSIGFIVTENGRYVGMGSGHDLLKLITQLQMCAARHANPLTLLPGNVPINEHIDALLQSGLPFVACYCDLDNFKPYNDVYGYKLGDDIIRKTGHILQDVCHPDLDFIGHIGGDDFIILFQSEDWEQRCTTALDKLKQALPVFFNETDRARGGIQAEDRQGGIIFYPLTSLSIGAVVVSPQQFSSHYEVAAATSVAKKQAKKTSGYTLFIERRVKNLGIPPDHPERRLSK